MRVHFTTDDGELLESVDIENPNPRAHADKPETRYSYVEGEICATFSDAWQTMIARAKKSSSE